MPMNKILLNLAFLLLPLTALGLEPWALVRVAVANVREKPSHAAEMGTQVVMGTPLKVDEQVGDSWLKITTPDGYKGYVARNTLTPLSENGMQRWRKSDRAVVTSFDQTYLYSPEVLKLGELPDSDLSDYRVSDVVNGCILNISGSGAGAQGYVTKTISGDDLVSSIKQVHEGYAVFSPKLAGFVLSAFQNGPSANGAFGGPIHDDELDRLSNREQEVMRLIARGYTYKEVASELFISIKTVETHMSSVLRKLQLSNRSELTRWAADRRIV